VFIGGSANWCDVSYYNAGAYGANSGGGSGPTLGTPNAGLWSVTGNAGGFFPTAAARNASTPPSMAYPINIPAGTLPIYMVGNHGPGRGGDGSSLAFRNDTPAGTGAAKYQYQFDTFDTGGPAASSVTSGNAGVKFYFNPSPDVAPQPGVRAGDKFTMSYMDASSNVGLEWGYTRDNEVVWRTGSVWTYTGIYANPSDWDGVDLTIDLTGDTFGLQYYIASSSTWMTMVPTGTPLGTAMTNFTTLGWQLEDAVNFGVGGKNFFDDFTVSVPAPGTGAIAALGGLLAARRRRR
jgi:hypothetical protein